MDDTLVLAIMGSFISLLLIINAYFTRETLLRVVSLEVAIKESTTKQFYNERQIDENTAELKKLRDRIHTVEGYQPAIIKALEDLAS